MLLGGSSRKNSISWQRIDIFEGLPPEARCSFSMCYHYGTKQSFVFGGKNSEGKPFDDQVHSLTLQETSDGVKAKWSVIESSRASSPGCIAGHSCVCIGDSLYIFGGQDKDDKYLNSLYEMDVKSGQWIEVHSSGQKPSPRSGHSMTYIGSYIYLFGGCNESGMLNDLHLFDVETKTWHVMPTGSRGTPSPRYGAALLGMRNTNDDGDLLCLMFGSNNQQQMSDTFTYSGISKAWYGRPSRGGSSGIQGGRSFFVSYLLLAGKVFMFGGNAGQENVPQNDSYTYDVLSGGWSLLELDNNGIAPSPRSHMSGFKQGFQTVVFGGLDNNGKTLNDLWYGKVGA